MATLRAAQIARGLGQAKKGVNLIVAGVTGAVGAEFLAVLERRNFPIHNVKFLASKNSVGKTIRFKQQEVKVEELTTDSFKGYDVALFSAGGAQSKTFAPAAVKAGCVVIDNSSAFRMVPNVPLVVPEVNPEEIKKHQGIIANPNCSTIIMNVPVFPFHKTVGVSRLSVVTYQAASGAGAKAMQELQQQTKDLVEGKELTTTIWKRQYIHNLFSHNSNVDIVSGYNEEEIKVMKETRKIFNDETIRISATCIRVPVLRAHCEAINITLRQPLTEQQVRELLLSSRGITIVDNRQQNKFPEPIDASGIDNILVGRIRSDLSQDPGYGWEIFVAGDQLLKGAALNAVQIAELL